MWVWRGSGRLCFSDIRQEADAYLTIICIWLSDWHKTRFGAGALSRVCSLEFGQRYSSFEASNGFAWFAIFIYFPRIIVGGGRGVTSIKYNETIGYTLLQPLRTGQVGNMRDKLCPDHLALEQTSVYQSFKRQYRASSGLMVFVWECICQFCGYYRNALQNST